MKFSTHSSSSPRGEEWVQLEVEKNSGKEIEDSLTPNSLGPPKGVMVSNPLKKYLGWFLTIQKSFSSVQLKVKKNAGKKTANFSYF